MTTKDIALHYLKKKRLVPLPCMGDGDSKGKTPLIKWREIQSLPSETQVTEWFTKFPDANIGFKTGAVSGILVLDNDGVEISDPIPLTPIASSQAGHFHYYFKNPDFYVPPSVSKVGKHLDIRCDQAFIVAPPSKHFNKQTGEIDGKYDWLEGLSPFDIDFAPCPEWLITKIKETLENTHGFDWSGALNVGIGARDGTLTSAAASLVSKGFEYETALSILRGINNTYTPPLEDKDVIGKLESAVKKFGKAPEIEPLLPYEDRSRKKDDSGGGRFFTGIPQIDAVTFGLRKANTFIIGGEQKSGKTGFGLMIVVANLKNDIPVGYIDTELTQLEFDYKLASIYLDKPITELEQQLIPPHSQLGNKSKFLHYANINDLKVNDNVDTNLILERIREMVKNGCKAIFLDNVTTLTNFITLSNNQAGWELISEFINKAINIIKETDAVLFLSIHPKKTEQWQVTPTGIKKIIDQKEPQKIFKDGYIVVKKPLTQDLLASNSALSQISGYFLIWRPFQNFDDIEFSKHSLILLNNFRHNPPAEIRMTFNGITFQKPTIEELLGEVKED